MAWHLYIEPIIVRQYPEGPVRECKYLPYNAICPYGPQDICLVAADVDSATDASIAGNADVTKIPDNLDSTVGGGATLNNLRSAHETRNIPGNQFVSGDTFRKIIRADYSAFGFLSRYNALSGDNSVLIDGVLVTLDTTFVILPQATRDSLTLAATQFGLDSSAFTLSTLRQVLVSVETQLASLQRTLGGVTI